MLDKSLALGQSPASAILVSISLAIFHIGFGISYVISTQPVYHVAIFVTSILIVITRVGFLSSRHRTRLPAAATQGWNACKWRAAFVFIVAFGAWTIDFTKCASLRGIRERVGQPWAWLFQFHGRWHVMTAIAAYDVMESIRACSEKNQLKAVYLDLVNRVGE